MTSRKSRWISPIVVVVIFVWFFLPAVEVILRVVLVPGLRNIAVDDNWITFKLQTLIVYGKKILQITLDNCFE